MTETYRTSGLQQIVAKLDKENTEQVIYTPETGVDGDGNPLPFFSFVDTLRLKTSISSLNEAILPNDFEELSDFEQRAALSNVMFVQSHILFELVMEVEGLEVVPALLGLVNRPPYYHFSLMTFLTDAASWPVAAGTIIKARVRDDGWGGLDGDDVIEIFGSARTEAPSFSAPPQQLVVSGNTSPGGAVGNPPGDVSTQNAVTLNGDPVTLNGDPVIFTPS